MHLTEEHFQKVSREEFNRKYGVEVQEEMNLEELTDYIEEEGLSYFYASFNHQDVLDAIEDEWDVAENLLIDYLCIDSIYIAIY